MSEVPWRELDSSVCSVARTLELVGDAWTVLVLRDLFDGLRRFDEIADHLGVARNVLTRRLNTLVDGGLVERREYREPGSRTRQEYRLTPRGRSLRPVLLALMEFGDEHLAVEGPPVRFEHDDCGGDVRLVLECEHGHRLSSPDRLRARLGPGARFRTRPVERL